MNKRLAWNFEINSDSPFKLPIINTMETPGVHWEARFFWPEHDIIALSGLEEHFLELSQYKIKHRSDCYALLPDADYNVKTRHDELMFKPMIQRTNTAVAYGKKIKLAHCMTDIAIEGSNELINPQALIQRIKNQGQFVQVEKEALVRTFESHPSSKMELARLSIGSSIYFSVSIESPVLSIVQHITQQMIAHSEHCDYVTFLKNHTRS